MTAAISKQLDLFLPLLEGIGEADQWRRFMAELLARTHARRGILFIALANAPADHEPTVLQLGAPRAVQDSMIDIASLMRLNLHPHGSLRPGRVYAVDEMLDFDDRHMLAHQREALTAMGIGYGRWMRVSVSNVADAWILLTREREDFSSSAVATLSQTAPYLRAALHAFVTISEERLSRIMAQATLARLGIGQVALDEAARVMAADPVAERALSFIETPDGRPGRKLHLPQSAAEQLERGCAAIASGDPASASPVLIGVDEEITLMLQPASFSVLPGMARPIATATFRVPAREDERLGAAVLRDHFHLSAREAALAQKLSRGETIAEAGRNLHLTEETARNYSKRIYARTGSRGQADLVRNILCGLAPLA